jgi:hypothetical protein
MRRDRTHDLRAEELARFDRTAVSDTSARMTERLSQRPLIYRPYGWQQWVGSRPSQSSGRRNSASKRVDLAFIAPDDGRKRHGQLHSRRHRWIDRQ